MKKCSGAAGRLSPVTAALPVRMFASRPGVARAFSQVLFMALLDEPTAAPGAPASCHPIPKTFNSWDSALYLAVSSRQDE